jgi:hypothetical protein
MTLSATSNKYSNATAFWQLILNSNGSCLAVDGIFGTLTRNATIGFQNDFGATPANGTVAVGTWNATQFALIPQNPNEPPSYRHQPTGYVDGFGTQYFTYYGGGGGEEAKQGWNPYVPQWFFNPFMNSQAGQSTGWSLIAASANRTIGSYSCTA